MTYASLIDRIAYAGLLAVVAIDDAALAVVAVKRRIRYCARRRRKHSGLWRWPWAHPMPWHLDE